MSNEKIQWDATNPCELVIFVTRHGGNVTFHHESGVTLLTGGLELAVAVGDSVVSGPNGLTVEKGQANE